MANIYLLDKTIRDIDNAKKEIIGNKFTILANFLDFLPHLKMVSEELNSSERIISTYLQIRGNDIKLKDVTNPEKRRIVEFAYPITIYEKINNDYFGCRIGVDSISSNPGKPFAPALMWENKCSMRIEQANIYTDLNYILDQIKPEAIDELSFFNEVLKNVESWEFDENHKKVLEEKIFKSFEDNTLSLFSYH